MVCAAAALAMSNLACEPVCSGLEKFVLYQTYSHLYIVGCDKRQASYRVLKILRATAGGDAKLSDVASEDYCAYSKVELKEMLEMIHEGNRTHGGLSRVATGYGLLGFAKFLDCYYVILVTQRRKVGQIGGNAIYGIKATEMIAIKPEKSGGGDQSLIKALVKDVNRRLNPTQREIAEQRYVGLFQFIDLTKDFFFSYTYDLTRTLQHNMTSALPARHEDATKTNAPSRAGTGRFDVASTWVVSERLPRGKHPRVAFAPRDDRSSKTEPKRVANDRDARSSKLDASRARPRGRPCTRGTRTSRASSARRWSRRARSAGRWP